ncbi:endonuclease domain-containing protein [Mobiluncus curtisii]|uniref:endonuclease domain-containing protein n=1 Tax=Mobiluncus curtisii TaxID=2051 RepID=UPI002430F5C4|nr:hypothetical protein [Mobiluncus curtisii]
METINCGVYTVKQLLTEYSTRDIADLVEAGNLVRIIRGWYAGPEADPDVVRALKHGGRLGCLSGCAKYGLWVPHQTNTHVILPENVPLPAARFVEFHRCIATQHAPVFGLEDCLYQAMRHNDAETGLIVLESALQAGCIGYDQAKHLATRVQKKKMATYRFLNRGAQSGSETRVRLFFQRRGVSVRTQHRTAPGWADLLVGNSWIVECDGREFHDNPRAFEIDRERDLSSATAGYLTTRLSYRQIWHDWERTTQRLSNILQKRRHRIAPRA